MTTRARRLRGRFLSFLLMVLMAWILMLASSSPCFAADIQPPTEGQADDFIERVLGGETDMIMTVSGEIMVDPPFQVAKTVKTTEIEKNDNGTVFVTYYLYVIFTTSTKAVIVDGQVVPLDESAGDEVLYRDQALLESTSWTVGTNQPLEETDSGYTKVDSTEVEIPPDEYGSAMDEAVAAIEASLQEVLDSYEHVSGWVAVSPSGETKESDVGAAEGGEGSKIPGPNSWWTWLTGTVIAGIIAAIAGFLNSLLGLPPVSVTPTTPPEKPVPPVKGPAKPPPKGPLGKELTTGKKKRHPGTQPPFDPLAFPPGLEPPPTGVAAGTADPFDLQKYPNQPADIGDAIADNLGIIKDAAGQTILDTGVAVKDGVSGFVHGLITIPVAILQGYVELGRLTQIIYSDYMSGKSSILSDLISSGEGWESLKEILGALGKELLPLDEIGSFFDNNSSLEEKLWAIPSAATKLANLIMMSEKLAGMRIPGISGDFTAINSLKASSRAIEAAKAAAASGVQMEYDAYKATANYKASQLTKTVEGGGKLSQEQVLDAMSDPATMRTIKNASPAVQKEFNIAQTSKVYEPVYDDIVGYMKGKDPTGTYKVGGVRTPGQSSLINTDNDVIVQKLMKTEDGALYWKEVPAHEWEGAYFHSFAKRTGFDPATAKTRFPEQKWDSMSPQQQQKTWTEMHGQEAMDVKNPEAAQSFSNQPSTMRPNWKPGSKSPVADGTIVDGEGLYNMESFKTTRGWKGEGATLKTRTEAMEQGCKLCNLSKKMAAQSYLRTGKVPRYPDAFAQGERIMNMRYVAPAVRDAALKEIGFKGGYEDFMQKLSSWTGRLP